MNQAGGGLGQSAERGTKTARALYIPVVGLLESSTPYVTLGIPTTEIPYEYLYIPAPYISR